MSLRSLLILLIISLCSSSHALGAPEETRTLKLSADGSTLPRLRVRVQSDPFYQRGAMIAEGVQLRALLEAHFGAEIWTKQSQYLLRFVCSDGYETIYPLSESVGSNGIVADRFIAWGEGERTQPNTEGAHAWPEGYGRRRGTNAGPYYLLWDQEEYDAKRPWPYQLTRIDLLSAGHLAALEPNPAAGVSKGHALFKTHCKACHKVNQVGGVMGPELNVPQNILSYRSRAQVKAFIRAPESFRLGSRMPAFQSLSEAEVDAIIDYLEAMNDRRVCKDLASCRSFVAAQQASH